jgi:iron uptake system component EfeO
MNAIMKRSRLPSMLAISVMACTATTDAEYRADVVLSIHESIARDLDALVIAARNLQARSPSRAWTAGDDAAIADMREAWKRMRTAYEQVEGAVVALFPGTDVTLDGRYEQLITSFEAAGDSYSYDARGFVGMHAIERILFAPLVRAEVVAFERTLPGYRPPSYPATDADAISFKTVLVQRLIDDADALRGQWQPTAIDLGSVYVGLMGVMNEQKAKVSLAVTGEEESRYANVTLHDLRSNVGGTQEMYGLFRAWILSKDAGEAPDARVLTKLGELATVYAAPASDALPDAPDDWSSSEPTPANLATPFGTLWKAVSDSVDPRSDGSVVFEMNRIAAVLGLPAFGE